MSHNPPPLSPSLYEYTVKHGATEHPCLAALRAATLALPGGQMISSIEQVRLIQLLIRLMQAQHVIEIGTFTGYTTLAMAMAMPLSGQVYTCDCDANVVELAMQYWSAAREREALPSINPRIMPALECLEALHHQGLTFDLAYIDADKKNNRRYYEKLLDLVRQGGLIIIDNVLWKAKVIDDQHQDKQTQAIREFNDFLAQDARVEHVMLLLGDGVSLAYKK